MGNPGSNRCDNDDEVRVFVFVCFITFRRSGQSASYNVAHPACVSRDLPISPRSAPMSFYRDAGSALLHLVNQWLSLWYSRPHAFRYGDQKKTTLLQRLDFTNSDLVGVCCTH